LNVGGEVKADQIKLYIQANGDNTQNYITFSNNGTVEDPEEINEPVENTDGFSVTVSTPDNKLVRCVRVITILGTMIVSEGESDTVGCPTEG
jgi:hypothetical protein